MMRACEPIDVLVVAPVPDFDRASGALRFFSMLRMLARKYRVTLLGWIDAEDPGSPRPATTSSRVTTCTVTPASVTACT